MYLIDSDVSNSYFASWVDLLTNNHIIYLLVINGYSFLPSFLLMNFPSTSICFFCLIFNTFFLFQASAVMRCPVIKFVTHTASHICFLILLAAATFRLTENAIHISSTDELNSAQHKNMPPDERTHSLLKETLRPANTLLTHVQICIVFWILGG